MKTFLVCGVFHVGVCTSASDIDTAFVSVVCFSDFVWEMVYVSVMSVSVAGVDEIYIIYWVDTDHKQRILRADGNNIF